MALHGRHSNKGKLMKSGGVKDNLSKAPVKKKPRRRAKKK